MHRRFVSIAVAISVLVALAAVIVANGPASADALTPLTVHAPLPAPSPSFSAVWMSVVTVDRDGRHAVIGAQSITADKAGDTRVGQTLDAAGGVSETDVYDASARTSTRAYDAGTGTVQYSRSVNEGPESSFGATEGAATVVRAALAEHDPALAVKSTTFIGRPAWTASYTQQGWRHTAVVDKATGVPLRTAQVSVKEPRTQRSVWRVVDLKVDPPIDAGTFTLDIPEGESVDQSDGCEHFAPLADLAAKVGYQPFVPATLPEGAELAAASTQPEPWGPYAWLFPIPVPYVDHSNLPDRLTSLYYSRGFDSFVVREWPMPGGIRNSVPAGLDKAGRYAYRKAAVTTGAFAGRTARTWFDDQGLELYVQRGSAAVLVTGDLSRSDALSLAASLEE